MDYPECEKMHKVAKETAAIGEFLEWLSENKKLTLCEYIEGYDDTYDRYIPYHYQIEELLAEFFKIDLNKVEKERRQILEDIRK